MLQAGELGKASLRREKNYLDTREFTVGIVVR
jgi:hypothetical protein